LVGIDLLDSDVLGKPAAAFFQTFLEAFGRTARQDAPDDALRARLAEPHALHARQ